MRLLLIYFSIGILGLYSCSDIGRADHLKSISQMNTSLDSIQKELYANQIDTLPQLINALMHTELRISQNYHSDTIDMEMGKKMDAFKRSRKKLKPLGKRYSDVRVGILEEQDVLKKLEKDITNGNGNRKKYGEYVTFELNKVDQLRILLNSYIKEKNATLKELERTFPEMYALSMSLKAKNESKK
jgi:hypothetical protein